MDKRYDYLKFEEKARKLWENLKIYEYFEDSSKKTFSIDTPPPTVSGSLHIGHIFSYTHTDIMARYKRMTGYNVFYPMGFDDNGLPTERFVEKTYKTKAHLHSRSDFIKMCLDATSKIEKEFEALWKKIGLSVDWTKSYSTINEKVRRIAQYSFIDLYNKKRIYRKEEPSLYCTTCKTAVAQAELENQEISTIFNDITFKLLDKNKNEVKKLTISTTRPELLPACVALFYNPKDSRYRDLEGKTARIPLYNREVPILTDDKVDINKGSGLVMCCTFGDQNDIYWYKKHKLPFIQAIELNGKWSEITGPLKGLRANDARKKIIELLKDNNLLISQKKIKHNVNVHDRCKQEIEYFILKQWFIKILDKKDKFLELGDKIEWKPEFMKSRYKDWVKNLNWDWCISRQRFYGIPFPVWHCKDCGAEILADKKQLPVDPVEEKYPNKCPICGGTNIVGDTDVMDTWNTSSLTPQINTNWPDGNNYDLNIPMSIRPQAHDIIRTWAFYTIIKSYYHQNNIPWKKIIISGHVLAGGNKKEKLSKSKGNNKIPTPEKLLAAFPSDAIRYWTATGKPGMDLIFSEPQLKIGNRLITKLWNAFRFAASELNKYIENNINKNELDNLTAWILEKNRITLNKYKDYFEKYNYSQALEVAEKFFWHDYCDNYLELIKDQIFNPQNYNTNKLNMTRYVLYNTGFSILQMFAPILPHLTEILFQKFYASTKYKSIHVTEFKDILIPEKYRSTALNFESIINLISKIRKLKTENKISLKTEIEILEVNSNSKEIIKILEKEENLIKGISKANKLILNINDVKNQEISKLENKNGSYYIKISI